MLPQEVERLLASFEAYRQARLALIEVLGMPRSNRDPLAEFSEVLVASLLESIQREYVVPDPDAENN